jgi:APA family basic amino acid/polyamine antiporter
MSSTGQQVNSTAAPSGSPTDFKQTLGLYDSTMIVAGGMIGSAIFIVSAEMARELGSSGWLLLSWLIAGALTITAALSYGELASMMPKAGGQYVYLRESYSPAVGFLYGWTLFLVIQTGTVAAVAVGFARYLGVLWPAVSESRYLLPPVHISSRYAISLSTAQLVAVLVIIFLTWTNAQGLKYGKLIQNVFTMCKIGALLGLILVGLILGANSTVIAENFRSMWTPSGVTPISAGLGATGAFGILVAIAISQTGSLFAADAWNNITFTAGEVRNPKRNIPLSLALGTGMVIGLYLLINLGFLFTLRFSDIQHVASDRIATATLHAVFPGLGVILMAIAIMVSTFGCMNGMLLTGSRAYYAMAQDGLFFRSAGGLNRAGVPGISLLLQGIWAAFLVLPRTFDTATGTYGNLYSNLLDYVVSAVLIFYVLTIIGVFRLRRLRPLWERPYRTFGYPVVPALYVLGATTILIILFCYRPATTIPGLVIIATGIPVYLVLRRKRSTE